jgi:hypothetical protein
MANTMIIKQNMPSKSKQFDQKSHYSLQGFYTGKNTILTDFFEARLPAWISI